MPLGVFQGDAFQTDAFQAEAAVADAFQLDAFQVDAFQVEAPATEPAACFQADAFQADAFQLVAIPPEIAIIFGGYRGAPERREDAVAYGDILTCFAKIDAGRVSTGSLFPGAAFGDAFAANASHLNVAVQIIPGTAAGERNFADDELLMIFAEAA